MEGNGLKVLHLIEKGEELKREIITFTNYFYLSVAAVIGVLAGFGLGRFEVSGTIAVIAIFFLMITFALTLFLMDLVRLLNERRILAVKTAILQSRPYEGQTELETNGKRDAGRAFYARNQPIPKPPARR